MRYRVVNGDRVSGVRSAEAAHRASRRANMAGSKVEREVATRFVGNCQACEGDFKLYSVVPGEPKEDDLRMVHHGYRRPGHGYIVGDCPGVGEMPYERSKDLVEQLLAGAEAQLAGTRDYLRRLESGEVRRITVSSYRGDDREYVAGVSSPYEWQRALDDKISGTRRDIDMLERFRIPHLRERIERWQLRPVRTFDEILAVEREKKTERAAVVAEKRAAREAKEAAKRAKRQAMEDKRAAIRRELAEKFIAFDAAGDRYGAHEFAARVRKKYDYDAASLGIDDVLIRLGVAERATHNQKLYWRR